MLLVKTYIDTSSIHGIGIFAAEFIAKDTKIWVLNSDIDLLLTEEVIQSFSEVCQKQIFRDVLSSGNS